MIFNCKKLAEKELKKIKIERPISLGVVQVGEDKVSEVYIKEKRKAAKKVGVDFNHYKLSEKISPAELKERVLKIKDEGIIIQLPIPDNFNTQDILNSIPFEKDIDGLSELALGQAVSGRLDIIPPVAGAVDKILKELDIDIKGKKLAVVGPGRLVGKPTILYGLEKGATVFSVDENSSDPEKIILTADVVVTGVGQPNLITGKMVKEGAVVIDAGVIKTDEGMVGDVDIDSVKKKATVTPVPGGVGPLTVVCLLENLIKRTNGF